MFKILSKLAIKLHGIYKIMFTALKCLFSFFIKSLYCKNFFVNGSKKSVKHVRLVSLCKISQKNTFYHRNDKTCNELAR